MRDDESEDSDIAPIPPYDRQWRHPAERAADERRQFAATATPPPLSRRSRTLISALAGAVAVAVFIVVIPRAPDQRADVDTTLPPVSTSSPVPVKGITRDPTVVVAGSHGSTTGLAVDDRTVIAALEDVTSSDTVWVTLPSGTEVEGNVSDVDANSGLALIRVSESVGKGLSDRVIRFGSTGKSDSWTGSPAVLSSLYLVDWLGAQQPVADDGLTTSTDPTRPIVHTARTIAGIAAVTRQSGDVVGIAIRRAQTTWILTAAGVRDILTGSFGLTSLPGRP